MQSTVDLAHALGLRIIAEGVENHAIFAKLLAYGCDIAQDYGIARPQGAEAITTWLSSRIDMAPPLGPVEPPRPDADSARVVSA